MAAAVGPQLTSPHSPLTRPAVTHSLEGVGGREIEMAALEQNSTSMLTFSVNLLTHVGECWYVRGGRGGGGGGRGGGGEATNLCYHEVVLNAPSAGPLKDCGDQETNHSVD